MNNDQSELQLQSECFLWTWNSLPETRRCIWHVPNEVKPFPGETKKELAKRIAKMKAAGLVPGVSDLHFQWKGQLHVFELKVQYNTLSDDQEAFRDKMTEHGAKFYEVRDFETFKTIFLSII